MKKTFLFLSLITASLAYCMEEEQAKQHVLMLHNVNKGRICTNLSKCDQYGNTQLHLAAYVGKKDVVSSLIRLNVNVDCKEKCGFAPLHFAVVAGHLEVVQELIGTKADINASGANGITPLHLAVVKHFPHILSAILACENVNIDQKTKRAHPLSLAIKEPEPTFECLRAVSAMYLSGGKYTALGFAVRYHNQNAVKLLINARADIVNKNSGAISMAYNNPEALRLLIDANANVDLKRGSPFCLAVMNNNKECAKMLLENGVGEENLSWAKQFIELNANRLKDMAELLKIDCCPICMQYKTLASWPGCNHQFCAQCILRWQSTDQTNGRLCPICRQYHI